MSSTSRFIAVNWVGLHSNFCISNGTTITQQIVQTFAANKKNDQKPTAHYLQYTITGPVYYIIYITNTANNLGRRSEFLNFHLAPPLIIVAIAGREMANKIYWPKNVTRHNEEWNQRGTITAWGKVNGQPTGLALHWREQASSQMRSSATEDGMRDVR